MAIAPRRSQRKPVTPARKASAKPTRDVTQYADKPATGYHKAFASWIVKEVGYDPGTDKAVRAAFLAGVSIATAARAAFQESDFLEEWREKNGESKPGRKPAAAVTSAPARRRKPEPEPEEEEEWEEEDETEADDEFDSEDDSEEEESEEEEWEDEAEEEPAPAPKRRAPAKKAAPAPKSRSVSGGARRPAPVKGTTAKRASKPPADDDDFIF